MLAFVLNKTTQTYLLIWSLVSLFTPPPFLIFTRIFLLLSLSLVCISALANVRSETGRWLVLYLLCPVGVFLNILWIFHLVDGSKFKCTIFLTPVNIPGCVQSCNHQIDCDVWSLKKMRLCKRLKPANVNQRACKVHGEPEPSAETRC